MGSRLRENVKQLFDCFCEVAEPSGEKQAWIIQRYPESYNDSEILKSVPKFAYPCLIENTVVQHFSFVLTSIDSKWTFGFCRHDPKTNTALVILSALPWHETFYKLLNHIASLTVNNNAKDLWKFLGDVYTATIPLSGASINIPLPDSKTTFICQRPKQFQLPSIPENRNLTEYFSAVDSHNMMIIFASMLYERRIIFTSKRLSRLSACVQACNALIYPMIWQHIYIPVLPFSLTDYLLAPMPFLIGVPSPILKHVRQGDLGEVVVLNADENTIKSPFQDLESLPQDVVINLKRALRNPPGLLGDGVSRAFLRALVQLTAGYREALTLQQDESDNHVRITFDQDAFVENRPISMQPFLRKMLELQIFQQFIEERLHMLNSGLGFSDEFEMEACNYSDKSGSKFLQQYREWTYIMRKEGSAFIRSVKDKANPAVKNAVKSVRDKGKDMKTVYKGFKWKGRGSKGENIMHFHHPRSAPNSPTLERRSISLAFSSKCSNDVVATTTYRKEFQLRNSNIEAKKQYSMNFNSLENQDLPLERLDINLMHELQDVIYPKIPVVDRSLKPVRSLESLRPGWNGRLRHGPPLNFNPYEHYQLPKNSPPEIAFLKDFHLQNLQAFDVSHSSPLLHRSSLVESYQPNNQKSVNLNSLDINPYSQKKQKNKTSLFDLPFAQPNNLSNEKKYSVINDEFINPINVFTHNRILNFKSTDDCLKIKDQCLMDTFKYDDENIKEAQTKDPFEALFHGSILNNIHENKNTIDPFDTSNFFNPFGLPNPLFCAENHNVIINSPSPLKNIDSCSTYSKNCSPEIQDLIKLDSTNCDDDFDPLFSRSSIGLANSNISTKRSQSLHTSEGNQGLSNPLYPYFTPQQLRSETSDSKQLKIGDMDLLHEYGLDFTNFGLSNGNSTVTTATTSKLILEPKPESTFKNNFVNKPFSSSFITSQQRINSPTAWTKFD